MRVSIAQTAAPALLSPQAAYDQASAPVDITHRSVENWSDVERASLDAAVAEAKDACLARTGQTYAGDALIAFARLCALGKQWLPVYTATTTYINSKDSARPQLGMAHAFEIQADLNLDHEEAAVGATIAMLRWVTYGPLADEVTTTTIRYLQFAYTADALSLLAVRQTSLLRLLSSSASSTASSTAPSTAPSTALQAGAAASVPVHTLFEHALDFAALEQYYNEPKVAAILVEEIDHALPAQLSREESILIAGARRRYALLGTKFPELAGAVYLMSATETPHRQPEFGPATVFFLFPPWCVQCVRQAKQIVPALVRTAVLKGPDYKPPSIYALLADTVPNPAISAPQQSSDRRPSSAVVGKAPGEAREPPKTVEQQLRKTPTLVVAPSVLADFSAMDFPFLIATDRDGIIRLMMPAAPDNALVQGGIVDQMTATIVSNWPAKETK